MANPKEAINKIIDNKLDKLKYQESVFISQDNTLRTAIVRAEIAVLEEVRDEIT
jgi:hypothetical protein